MRSKPYVESAPITCHCDACDEPDPFCDHGVNLATSACATCDAIAAERVLEQREALDGGDRWSPGPILVEVA